MEKSQYMNFKSTVLARIEEEFCMLHHWLACSLDVTSAESIHYIKDHE